MSHLGFVKRRLTVLATGAVLLAVLSALALHAVAHGDEGVGEPGAMTLGPTQIVAQIPEEHGALFPVQWGGGALHQLRGELAALGCVMNNLWLYNGGRWHLYSHYDVPRETFFIEHFIRDYADAVPATTPATTIWASCSDQPVQQLQPTEVIANVPAEHDTEFELQWGGGSLFHLKGRLATMDCMVNDISFNDDITGVEYVYNQYNTSSADKSQFVQAFEQFVPAGTLYATCIDLCTFQPNEDVPLRRCLTIEEMATYEDHTENDGWIKRRYYDGTPSFLDVLHETERCRADFSQTVKDRVLTRLPIRPDICIVRGRWSGNNIYFNFPSVSLDELELKSHHDGFLRGIHARPIIFLFDPECRADSFFYLACETNVLHTEIHELCHANQDWHWLQNLSADMRDDNAAFNLPYSNFISRTDIKELVELVGFTHPGPERSGYIDLHKWELPRDSVFREIYSDRPGELAAELCAMYLMDKAGAESKYRYYRWVPIKWEGGKVTLGHPRGLWEPRDIDVNRWLTPEIREWLETYMILPALDE